MAQACRHPQPLRGKRRPSLLRSLPSPLQGWGHPPSSKLLRVLTTALEVSESPAEGPQGLQLPRATALCSQHLSSPKPQGLPAKPHKKLTAHSHLQEPPPPHRQLGAGDGERESALCPSSALPLCPEQSADRKAHLPRCLLKAQACPAPVGGPARNFRGLWGPQARRALFDGDLPPLHSEERGALPHSACALKC